MLLTNALFFGKFEPHYSSVHNKLPSPLISFWKYLIRKLSNFHVNSVMNCQNQFLRPGTYFRPYFDPYVVYFQRSPQIPHHFYDPSSFIKIVLVIPCLCNKIIHESKQNTLYLPLFWTFSCASRLEIFPTVNAAKVYAVID